MSKLTRRRLNDENSNKVLEELGCVLLNDISENNSIWNVFPYGRVYFPVETVISSWKDVVQFIAKHEYARGVQEGEFAAYKRLEKVLIEVILKKNIKEHNANYSSN